MLPDIRPCIEAAINAHERGGEKAVDREDLAVAADVAERLLPQPGPRAAVLGVLGELIERAHARGDRKWAVTLFGTLIRVNVGAVHVAVVLPEMLFLEVDPAKVDEATRAALGARLVRERAFKSTGPALELYLPAEDVVALWPRLREASLAFVDAASARDTSLWGSHSPGLLAYLDDELGRPLPRPADRGQGEVPAGQPELAELEALLGTVSRSHREFFIPIVRAMSTLGGGGRSRDVVAKIRELLRDQLTPEQLDYLENNNRFGWARDSLKKRGVVVRDDGRWELTALGEAYAAAHANDALKVELEIPEATRPSRSSAVAESIEVSGFHMYDIPALSAMAAGHKLNRDILGHIERELGRDMLPGDRRVMPNGEIVWRFRAARMLYDLGREGLAENTGTGEWVITSRGRERLEAERGQWQAEAFRGAKAKVVVEGDPRASNGTPPPEPVWPSLHEALYGVLPEALIDQLQMRLRPDLGPSPDASIPRNVILYGPPGTGKTHVAKLVARALTGEDEAREDGRFRLVQFHPSYAYEDFVQGMRPDINQTQLQYKLHEGPFRRVAKAAEDQPDAFFVLVIDEINRGDPARIFGELLYALEYRDEAVALALGGELRVPSNLVVIGTMNSVDRSVALVDYALRRRFGFVRVEPDSEVIGRERGTGVLGEVGPVVLDAFNAWLAAQLGREHVLGHSFFLSRSLPDAADAFVRLWEMDVGPLLEEYFFGDTVRFDAARDKWTAIVADALVNQADVQREAAEDASA